jgi:hypothetical protein
MAKKTRKTRYGLPVTPVASTDNTTPYGAKIFRTPLTHNEFAGPKGTPMYAGILDIDGTLMDWSKPNQKVLDWMETVEKRYPDMVWLVITARTHQHDYERSFDWLHEHVPSVFIGPFCRAKDDPRYASEFKRELAQGFEDMGLYKIVAAADDNEFVIAMWKHWAQTHFADPTQFDLLETSYSYRAPVAYGGDYGLSYYTPHSGPHKGERWVNGSWVNGKWENGHWEKTQGTHRPAGTSRWADEYGWGTYDRWEGRDDGVQGALARMESDEPSVSLAAIQADRERLDLEAEIYANYPNLGYDEIEALDTAVLREMFAAVDQPDTEALDVEVLFEELGEKPYTEGVA